MTHRKFAILLALPLATAACTTSGEDAYPSLAIRDAERAQGTFEPAPAQRLDVPEVEVDVSGGLDARLTALLEQAQAAHADFLDSTPEAERRVSAASGSAIGSDVWAAAQVSLADLDSARSHTAIALGDLDSLYTAAAVQAAAEVAAIETTRQQVLALVGEEDATLARLRDKVR